MIRKKSIKLMRFFFSRIIIFYFGGVWNLKDKLNEMKYSYTKLLLISIYNKYFDKRSSYIGSRSTFKKKPIFPHGINSIWISDGASIGQNCIIFQQSVVGSNNLEGSIKFGSPTIGDNVIIGAGAMVIGNIKIGDNCRIGANCVVYNDMPSNTTAVMQPTRILYSKIEVSNRLYSQSETKEGFYWGYYDKDGRWILDENFKVKK